MIGLLFPLSLLLFPNKQTKEINCMQGFLLMKTIHCNHSFMHSELISIPVSSSCTSCLVNILFQGLSHVMCHMIGPSRRLFAWHWSLACILPGQITGLILARRVSKLCWPTLLTTPMLHNPMTMVWYQQWQSCHKIWVQKYPFTLSWEIYLLSTICVCFLSCSTNHKVTKMASSKAHTNINVSTIITQSKMGYTVSCPGSWFVTLQMWFMSTMGMMQPE